eukprot:CAMPEP_0113687914 /NCGR_PEP_ID=MMETSP0038_2-20120614/16217_1 /TAXON_ID=2898 /ORGANISM="Cryptomonas paramecium" /LENGTH=234 /DNA_ID=CAMNT_0000608615 /DNA_START=83 /DNA_END=784 /DNA_ORIENTATION=- /assembly_acc=CAM_ASM_000170
MVREQYTYTQVMEPQSQYTYSAELPSQGIYQYNIQSTADQGGQSYSYSVDTQPQDKNMFTYSANVQPEGTSVYAAEPAAPQTTTITGYATLPQEQWNTIPIGTLHPLDTAGNWKLGSFSSLNPDGTARASAPLTLSGERDDGTVRADARSPRNRGLVEALHARTTALALSTSSEPMSSASGMSPEAQRRWADDVLEWRRQQEIYSASPRQVLVMPAADRRLWARHTLEVYRARR